MGFNITQIINKFVPVQILGSANRYSSNISVGTGQQSILFPFTTRQVLIINDGASNINFALDGSSSLPGTNYPYSNSVWSYIGTWSTSTFNSHATTYINNTTVGNAVFKPNISGLTSMVLGVIQGLGAGIAKIELSTDNGVTWKNPSSITGVTRSDGAAGTSLDTYDSYANVSTQYGQITYNLPYNSSYVWAMRISATSTENAAATGGNSIFLCDMTVNTGYVFTLYPKENLQLDVQTTQINLSSPSSTTGRVIAI